MQQIIYERLMNKWEQTGYIGRVFCNTKEKAKKVAYMAALSMVNKNNNNKNLVPHPPLFERDGALSHSNGCGLIEGVQLKIQFI